VHEVALVDDQLKVEPLPLITLVGFALIDTLGGVPAPALPLMVTTVEVGEPKTAPCGWAT
jgi:hypothetical protein